MRKQFGSSFQKTIEKMKWPGKDLVLTDDLIQEWTDGVELLLDLQEPYEPFLSHHSAFLTTNFTRI